MIFIPALPLALFFIAAVLFAAVCIAIGWLSHMLWDAENKPRPVVIKPWAQRGEPVLPAYRPAARLTRRSTHRCADRLPAAPVIRMGLLVDDATAAHPLLTPEFPLLARARFFRTDAGLRQQADAIAAKREARKARQTQPIISVPIFETAGAR